MREIDSPRFSKNEQSLKIFLVLHYEEIHERTESRPEILIRGD